MKIRILSLILAVVMCVALCACGNNKEASIWDNALYKENTEIGSGEKALTIDVVTEEKTVTVTVNTDKDTLGEALLDCGFIGGDDGPYGLYVKYVNGIEADYDKTQTYWGVTKDGESIMTGVDLEKIQNGDKYEFTYTK